MTGSARHGDVGGPRPENQLKRVEIRKARHGLIGLLAIVALAAIAFAVLRRSDARFLGLPPGYLANSTALGFTVLIAATHALAAVLFAVNAARARLMAGIAGALLMVAGVGVILLVPGVNWVPATLLFGGFIELLLVAGATPRKPRKREHVPGRR
ncbi:MAG: hypothetical protein WKG01_00045 [Kofleriaceae bacterium]